MSGMREAARKVVQSLESKPGLFYEVMRIVRDEYEVMGPWVDSPDGRESERHDVRDLPVAKVTYQASADRYDWAIQSFEPMSGTTVDESGSSISLAEAKAAADGILQDMGYLLA